MADIPAGVKAPPAVPESTEKSSSADGLRQEIVESQKFTVDLEKWKIILVAALGSAALGVFDRTKRLFPVLLAFIPLVCVYVDLLVYHNALRIMVISHFLQGANNTDPFARNYETYCQSRRDMFPLEEWALFLTTLFLSVTVGAVAGAPALAQAICLTPVARGAVLTAAVLGALVTTVTRVEFHYKLKKIAKTPAGPGKAPNTLVTIGIAVGFVVIAVISGWVTTELMGSPPPASNCQSQGASVTD